MILQEWYDKSDVLVQISFKEEIILDLTTKIRFMSKIFWVAYALLFAQSIKF
jgi:hypothetical protein